MTGGELLPATAWEQAAIIGIFIVFVGILLTWFSKQADKWQKFMFDIDEKWREFNREQREENNCAMGDVEKSLKDLTQVTGKLVQTMDELRSDIYHQHNNQVKEIAALVQKPAPKPRVKKPVENIKVEE
jgi:uncharacterized membrane protein